MPFRRSLHQRTSTSRIPWLLAAVVLLLWFVARQSTNIPLDESAADKEHHGGGHQSHRQHQPAHPSSCLFKLSRSLDLRPPDLDSIASQEGKDYCEQTNPDDTTPSSCFDKPAADPNSRDSSNGDLVASSFHVVLTFTESELREWFIEAHDSPTTVYDMHLAWLDDIPVSKTVIVKGSHLAKSFRGNDLSWDGIDVAKRNQAFKTVLRRVTFTTCVEIIEHPNVGDEALSVAGFIAAKYEALKVAAEANGGPKSHFVVFAHGHRDSWHQIDLPAQLRCLCMEHGDHYRTLTSARRAFFLQCMPLVPPDEIEVPPEPLPPAQEAQVKGLAPPEAARLRRYFQRQREGLWNISRRFTTAFSALLPGDPVPQAVIRDCCASFVVSVEAIVDRPHSFYNDLEATLRQQPNARRFPLLDGDASMYIERFWRYLFGATGNDFFRDATNIRCTQPSFVCPGSGYAENVSSKDYPEPWASRPCPSQSLNKFVAPDDGLMLRKLA